MSDTRLRALERRWKETNNVDDEVAYLRERIRVGDLTEDMLELAAYCGHEAARIVLGDEARKMSRHLYKWVWTLHYWGRECEVRASLSAAQSVIHIWANQHPDNCSPQQAIQAVVNCIIDPSYDEAIVTSGQRKGVDDAGRAAWNASIGVPVVVVMGPNAAARAAANAAWAVYGDSRFYVRKVVHEAEKATKSSHVRQAISADLITWALGYGDPVRDFLNQERAHNE